MKEIDKQIKKKNIILLYYFKISKLNKIKYFNNKNHLK